jgi:hypothetical protein
VSGYLGRQLGKGRRLVLLLAQDDTRAGSVPRSFGLVLRATGSVEYVQLPFARRKRFPPRVRLARLNWRMFELQPVTRAPSWREIRIGDVDHDAAVVLEGFHAAERENGEAGDRPYRWTGSVARLALPPVAEGELLLDAWRPPSAPPAHVEVDIDGVPVEGIRGGYQGSQCLRLRLPQEPVAAKRIVTLRAHTFSMSALGISADARQLGVRVFAVSIGGPSCRASTPRVSGSSRHSG